MRFLQGLSKYGAACAMLATAALMHSANAVDLPPHDGWVLERTYGSLDPNSALKIVTCSDIAVSASGDVYAVGPTNLRVTKYPVSGAPTPLNLQTSTTVKGLAVRGNATLFVTDSFFQLIVYDLQSNQPISFDPDGAAFDPGPVYPSIDPVSGDLYITDTKTVHRYDASNRLLQSWGVIPEFADFVRGGKPVVFQDGNVLVNRSAQVYVFTPAGSFVRLIVPVIPTLGYGISTRAGLVFAYTKFYDGFGNSVGRLPTGQWTTTTFGADGSLYACDGTGAAPFQVFKFRPAYRTVDTLVGAPALPISQVMAVQARAGTTIVDIDYRVHDHDSATTTTAALALIGGVYSIGAARRITTLIEGTSANVGAGIATHTTKRLTWDAGADLSSNGSFAQAKILLLANDGRGIVDLHYVTLPANVPTGGDPVLMISDTPITDADMLTAWLWLLGKGDPDVGLVNGELVKIGGGDAGTVFAAGTTTTAAGRAYLFQRLGVHEASASEIVRAKVGTTPGVQQYEPIKRVGARPVKVNEVGFDAGAVEGYWVVPN